MHMGYRILALLLAVHRLRRSTDASIEYFCIVEGECVRTAVVSAELRHPPRTRPCARSW
jgi:hypothetical protein